jgi:hypothetical protein
MRLRQSPMIEASALMAISLVIFMFGLWIIQGDIQQVATSGPLLAAMLLFPAYVLWMVFGLVARDAKVATRALTSIGVTLAVASFGALLLQGSLVSDSQQEGILIVTQIVIAFTLSGLVATAVTFGWLLRESKLPDPTLLTKPVVPVKRKKRK